MCCPAEEFPEGATRSVGTIATFLLKLRAVVELSHVVMTGLHLRPVYLHQELGFCFFHPECFPPIQSSLVLVSFCLLILIIKSLVIFTSLLTSSPVLAQAFSSFLSFVFGEIFTKSKSLRQVQNGKWSFSRRQPLLYVRRGCLGHRDGIAPPATHGLPPRDPQGDRL